MYILEYMVAYRQIQQHYIQQHKGKSFKCIILYAMGTQQPLGAAPGRHVTLKYEAASPLYTLYSLVEAWMNGIKVRTRTDIFFHSGW